MSTGALKGDELLNMPSDLISEGVIFQNFLGACPQTPLALACFACLCAVHTMTVYILAIPTSTMMTHLAVPLLFPKSGSAPGCIAAICALLPLADSIHFTLGDRSGITQKSDDNPITWIKICECQLGQEQPISI